MHRQGSQCALRKTTLASARLASVGGLLIVGSCVSHRFTPPSVEGAGDAAVLLRLDRPMEGEAVEAVPRAVKKVRRHWQRHYRRSVAPRSNAISEAGSGAWGEGFRTMAAELYSPETFDEAAAVLHRALLDPDSESETRRLLQNELVRLRRALLTYRALVAEGLAENDPARRKAVEEAWRRVRAVRQQPGRPPPETADE